MGYVLGRKIKLMGDYILQLLAQKGSVCYGETFYDGTNELQVRLRAAIGVADDDYYPALYADWAISQLRGRGLVVTVELTDLLPDYEPDYQITLTPKGKEFLAGGGEFVYCDFDL